MRNKIITTHYLTSDFATVRSRISFFQDLVSDLSVDTGVIRLQKNNMMVSINININTNCEWYYVYSEDIDPKVNSFKEI